MLDSGFETVIQSCNTCAVACTKCAIECLNEDRIIELKRCIQLDLACAAICRACVEQMSMGSEFSASVCNICVDLCNACAEECEKFLEMDHCRECANECRNCAVQCKQVVTTT